MKDIMIKVVVVFFALSVYFNVQLIIDSNNKDLNITNLDNSIENLETLNDSLITQIGDLQDRIKELENQDTTIPEDDTPIDDEVVDSCLKLYEITITVINEGESFDQSVVHCTNEAVLGDALDEMIDNLSIVYDPRYSKDYVYGRLVHSFYGFGKDMDEYYAIYINGEYAEYGIDFLQLVEGNEYEFILTRWE